jgi:hypothetical protein
MANAAYQKKGLTTFGWLLLGGAAAAFLSNKERRDKVLNSARDLAGKLTPSRSGEREGGATRASATPA